MISIILITVAAASLPTLATAQDKPVKAPQSDQSQSATKTAPKAVKPAPHVDIKSLFNDGAAQSKSLPEGCKPKTQSKIEAQPVA